MRQAILGFGDEALYVWEFDGFQDAGITSVEILSCSGSRGVVRFHVEEELDDRYLDDMEHIQWWEHLQTELPDYVYLIEFSAPYTEFEWNNDDN